MAHLWGPTRWSGSGPSPRGGCRGSPCAAPELLARHGGHLPPGRPLGPRSAAVWSSIQGSPRFQKLARDRERGVRLSGDVPAEGTPPSGSAGRANERWPAKRRCRWSSCCRPRAGRAPGAELGPPKPSPQTRGLLQHPHGIGPRGTAEAGERGQAPTPWLRAGTRGRVAQHGGDGAAPCPSCWECGGAGLGLVGTEGAPGMAWWRGPVRWRALACGRAPDTHRYTQSPAPRAEFAGFFIGFSTATTRSPFASQTPAAAGNGRASGTARAGRAHGAAPGAGCTHLVPFFHQNEVNFLPKADTAAENQGEASAWCSNQVPH